METETRPQIEGPIGDTPTAPVQSVEVVTDPNSNSVSPIPTKHENNNVGDIVSAVQLHDTHVPIAPPISMTSVVTPQGEVCYIPTEHVISATQALDLMKERRIGLHLPEHTQANMVAAPDQIAATEHVAVTGHLTAGDEVAATEHVAATTESIAVSEHYVATVHEVPQPQEQHTQALTAHQNAAIAAAHMEHGVLPAAVAAAQQLTIPAGQVGMALPAGAHQQMQVHPVQLHTPTIIHLPSSEIKQPSATVAAAMAHIPSSYSSVITQHMTQPSIVSSSPSIVTSIQNVMPTPQEQLAANAALLTQQLAAAGIGIPIKTERLDATGTKVYVSEYGKVGGGVLNPALYAMAGNPALYTQQIIGSAGQFPVKSDPSLYTTTQAQMDNTATSQGLLFSQPVLNTTNAATKVTATPESQTIPNLSAALLMQQLAAGVLGYQLRGDLNQQSQLALAGITTRPDSSLTSHPSPTGLGLFSNQVSTITANPSLLSSMVTEANSKTVATPTGGILPSLFSRPPGTYGMLSVPSVPSQQLQSTSLVNNPAQMLYNIATANNTIPQYKVETTNPQSPTVNPVVTSQPLMTQSAQPLMTQSADNIGLYPVKIQPLNPINGDEVEVQTENIQQSLPSVSLPSVNTLHGVNTLGPEGSGLTQEEVKNRVVMYQALDSTTCIVCGKTFKSRNNLKVHLRSHSGEKPYTCSSCGRCFTQSSSLNRHAKIHKKKYKCKYCDTSFTKKRYLKEHKRTHKLERKAKQEMAIEEQMHEERMRQEQLRQEQLESLEHHEHVEHVPVHHAHEVAKPDPYVSAETRTLEKPFKCPQCHITFALSVDLRQHVGTHVGQKPVPVACRWCSKQFQHSWDLKCHERTHHNVEEVEESEASKPKVEACRWCGQEFQHSWDLKCHEASHHLAVPEEPVVRVQKDPSGHMCRYCHKSFTRRGVLKRHERIHTGERPYVCPHCKKGFAVGNNLKQHIRTHTGEKPYTCDTCGRAFAQGSSLKRHQAIHEKDGGMVPKER